MFSKLSVRRAGWAIADDVLDTGLAEDRDARRLVILIHGFNVSEQAARGAFMDMRAGLRAAIPGGLGKLGAIWEFHWPGDHPSGWVSKGTYPARVYAARDAGRLLAEDWLAQRTQSEKVILIAHSLGCRVALEAVWAIRRLRERGRPYDGPDVEAVFLLAAAVPVDFCTPGHVDMRYGTPLTADSKEHVFHSRRDQVLTIPFEAGQGAIPEPGNAVGRRGLPGNRWSSDWPKRLGHGDYWASREIANDIAGLLHLSGEQAIPEHLLPVEKPADPLLLAERRRDEQRLPSRVA